VNTDTIPEPCCALGGGGGDEVAMAPFPQLFRARAAHRVHSSDRYKWWVLVAVLGGLLSVNITFTILAVALTRIAADFHTTVNTMTWVITGPLLAFGITAPTFGKAGDIYGYKRLYLIGIAASCVCSLLSVLAWSAGALIVIRTIGSVEGAATGAASVAIICTVFSPDDRVKAMGFWSLVGAGGPVIGVAIGGPLIQAFGWRAIFAAQVPLQLIAVTFAAIVLPETVRGLRQRFDWAGALTLTIGVTSMLFALNRGPEWGWSSAGVIISFALGPLGLLAFVVVELRVSAPLLPLSFLRRPNFAFPIASQTFGQFAYMGGFILAPTLLERVFHYSESGAGLMVIARPLTFSVTAPIAGYLAVRWGERSAAVVGTAAVALSMLVFASIHPSSSALVIVAALALSGVGSGIASPSITASIANAVDESNLGIASAAAQLTMQIGVVAGIQMMSTIQASREPIAGLMPSYADAYLVGAAVCALGIVAGFFVRSAERGVVRQERPELAGLH
jgi:EmrB/QacA subfamily drug resistance transporter